MSATETVCVIFDGVVYRVPRGALLSDALGLDRPCGGHGKCGKCKVIAKGALSEISRDEREKLTEAELHVGMRLACRTRVEGDCTVRSVSPSVGAEEQILTRGDLPQITLSPAFSRYGAAVDIGTTTLAARLYDRHGALLSEASASNPQGRFGADVVSRIEAALGGEAEALRTVLTGAIDKLLLRMSGAAGIKPHEIDGLVVTGNTAMLCFLTATSTEQMSHAPFRIPRRFGEVVSAGALGLSALSEDACVYLPPCIGAFVGADTVCALLSTELGRNGESALLADVGTNGELALSCGGRLLVCSTAAGPAFEGVGISSGMRASTGAVDRVAIVNGELSAHVIGEGRAYGICGSGLVDAVACLLDLEQIDETGYLEDEPAAVQDAVTLTGKDVRMVQLAKGAVCAGIRTLLDAAGASVNDLSHLFVAGGFGSYLNMKNAERIGLFPRGLAERTHAVGNAALAGASMLLLSVPLRNDAETVSRTAETVELATSPVFAENYMTEMSF